MAVGRCPYPSADAAAKPPSMEPSYDIAVIGGGVNGAGIARDAAGRGLKVLLVEQGDLAGATSSASTKLIHGGLRYLEQYAFRLVREALAEREVLLRAAPHIIRPLRFVLPHRPGTRPWWMLRAGLFLYDHLGGRAILPGTRVLDLARDEAGAALRPGCDRAFEYSDCWVDDSRLVVLLARDAAARGATIRTRTSCIAARRENTGWSVALADGSSASARILVNAAGPWVRQVKGSHIVTRRLFAHDRAYIFQNTDGRVCFAIPYETDFTLIGTTDLDYRGDPAAASISSEEEQYLLDAAGAWLREPPAPEDVVWRYAGVRPLYDDGSARAQEATRDYVLDLDAPQGEAPLLSVIGGKITTFRRLAEAALAKLAPFLPGASGPWTKRTPLPGGDFPWDGAPALAAALAARHPFLDDATARRLIRAYGTDAETILEDARRPEDLGRDFGAGLTEREVDWMMRAEWARTEDDVLWRRSKLGLRLSQRQAADLADWMAGARA